MTEQEKVVNAKELEKIKKQIDDVMKKSTPLPSCTQRSMTGNETDLDEKDKEIFGYIKDNPNIIKQDIIDAFNKKPGYSRKPILRRVNRLEKELHMVVVTPDKANSQIHHLSVNYENELASLIVDLDAFKQNYFKLIGRIDSFVKDRRKIFRGLLGLIENCRLVNAVLTPLKLILNLYNTFDLFLLNLLDNESLHRRFAIIRDTIKEIQNKLYDSVFKEPLVTSCDTYFTNTFLYDNLTLSNNILHSATWGVNHKNIEGMLITLHKYGLSESAEILLDSLWKLIYPIFFIIYSRYNKGNPNGLEDWRKVIEHSRRIDTTTQILAYRNVAT